MTIVKAPEGMDVERVFREAGAPWPTNGAEIIAASIFDVVSLVDWNAEAGWARRFFAHAVGIDADEATTNLVTPHRFPHAFVCFRVGFNFSTLGFTQKATDAVSSAIAARARQQVLVDRVPARRLPFYVPSDVDFEVTFTCAPPRPDARDPGPPVAIQCVLDALIVRR